MKKMTNCSNSRSVFIDQTRLEQLADHFSSHIFDKYGHNDEIRVILDRYDIKHSLKETSRARRIKNDVSVAYHMTDHTNITKVPLKLLVHSDTKLELTDNLAEKQMPENVRSKVVVARGSMCRASHQGFSYLDL